jgi:hypothetical protein
VAKTTSDGSRSRCGPPSLFLPLLSIDEHNSSSSSFLLTVRTRRPRKGRGLLINRVFLKGTGPGCTYECVLHGL